MRELGYVEGQNLFIERRYAEGREELLPQLANELVQYGVDIIFAIGPPQALAAAKATDKIPIVFVGGGDPVALGLVKSFAHPGGNVTGLDFRYGGVGTKTHPIASRSRFRQQAHGRSLEPEQRCQQT